MILLGALILTHFVGPLNHDFIFNNLIIFFIAVSGLCVFSSIFLEIDKNTTFFVSTVSKKCDKAGDTLDNHSTLILGSSYSRLL